MNAQGFQSPSDEVPPARLMSWAKTAGISREVWIAGTACY
jgi:hypothetical protein